VCWIIRNITDPEAIESAIRLAGTVRWFDHNVDVDPPFNSIISIFEACFDSTRKPYPGMRDRAYFQGRAILHINIAARLESRGCASKRTIPCDRYRHHTEETIIDLRRVLSRCTRPGKSKYLRMTFEPSSQESRSAHSIWMSNLHMDITRADPDSRTRISLSKPNDIGPLGRAIEVNAILSWYIFLSGLVQEETFWADKKSYVVILHSHFPN
jgi:hypothetical protein